MSYPFRSLQRLIFLTAFCGPTVFFAVRVTATQEVRQTESVEYFPPGALDGFTDFFSQYLKRLGEPSLFGAVQDSTAQSYRFVWLSGQHGYKPAVRLSLNRDGTATVTTIFLSGTPPKVLTAQRSVTDAELKLFLQSIEKANFWSMPRLEEEKPSSDRRAYKMDASDWVFEGVRNGRYHVVFRQGPESSAFTEMVQLLTRNLAKLDESAIPRVHPGLPTGTK